jgi:multidrug efflux system membrane fusion protein
MLLWSAAAEAAGRKLAFPVAGVVEKIMVRAGQAVKAGDALAALDQRPFAARERAAAENLLAAENSNKFATENHQRVKQLFDDLSTSSEELEKAQVLLLKAQAGLARAKSAALISKWRLERATLRAPKAGTVAAVPGYPGMVVNPLAAITAVVILDMQ